MENPLPVFAGKGCDRAGHGHLLTLLPGCTAKLQAAPVIGVTAFTAPGPLRCVQGVSIDTRP